MSHRMREIILKYNGENSFEIFHKRSRILKNRENACVKRNE